MTDTTTKTDTNLGLSIRDMLLQKGIETPRMLNISHGQGQMVGGIARNFTEILSTLGLNLADDSLEKTPGRVAEMYVYELFKGLDYSNFPKSTTVENKMGYNELITVSGIKVHSVCEHHLVPFIGTAAVAYIPAARILGLSKFNRIVDFFCRRPQIQERLTEQVAATLQYILDTEDVAVVMRAEHFCVKLRGVKDQQSLTTTSKLGGKFLENPALRSEFLALANANANGRPTTP